MGIAAQNDTELELISRCQAGDRQAFNRLVMTYQNLVYNFLYRLAPKWNDLDDLAQEVFVKVYHSVKHLKDRSQFKTWLHQIAVRVYVDEYRRRKKTKDRFVSDENILETQADPQATQDQQLARAELHRRLQEAIAELPEEFRLAIVLREIQELAYEEIANTLNCSIGTVRSRIFRGRQLLQQGLKELRVASCE